MELTFIALFDEGGTIVEREVGVDSTKILYHTRSNMDEETTCLVLVGKSILIVKKRFEEVSEIKRQAGLRQWLEIPKTRDN